MKADQVLLSYMEKMREVDPALEYVHPEAIFIAVCEHESERHPFYGTYRGVEGARTLLSKLQRELEPQEVKLHRMLTDEGSVFAWGEFRHRVRSTGRIFASSWAVACEVEDGKIKHFRVFEDSGALEAAFRKE
ncbi:nuclear transport factor 2 family protein [Paenibacillus albicereus]|uniref:Nuclear transport factor 2 family protein n=1 Tax=Paenibacillus albicereus TaxID=2726185 RepID=A0A6H2GZ10_9BACL|nr:nuclear transport factor 2 family protein [Paenibacillus albicereus]QJC52632.1 nuclear transport factor 2 family protein [Paenibacillus albicereus]